MTENTSIQNNEIVRAIAKHFPGGKWEFVQNQDEESSLTTEPIRLTAEEQAELLFMDLLMLSKKAVLPMYGIMSKRKVLTLTQGSAVIAHRYTLPPSAILIPMC